MSSALTEESFDAALEIGAFKEDENELIRATLLGNLQNAKALLSSSTPPGEMILRIRSLLKEEWGSRADLLLEKINENQTNLEQRIDQIRTEMLRIGDGLDDIGKQIDELNQSTMQNHRQLDAAVADIPHKVIEGFDKWAKSPIDDQSGVFAIAKKITEEQQREFELRVASLMDSELERMQNDLFQNSEFKKLEIVSRARIRIDPNNAIAWGNLGMSLGALGKLPDAENALRTSVDLNSNLHALWRNLGHTLALQGKLKEACPAFEKAIEVNPKYFDAWDERGTVLRRLEDLKGAEAAYRRALQINPNAAETWANLGSLLKRINCANEAEEAFRKAIQLKPMLVPAWINYGNLLSDLERYEEAIEAYKHALSESPDDYHANLNLGFLYVELKAFQKAEECFQHALKVEGNKSYVWFGFGNLYHEMGRFMDAEQAYVRAIELNPRFLEAWHNLGNVQSGILPSKSMKFTRTFAETVEKLRGSPKGKEK